MTELTRHNLAVSIKLFFVEIKNEIHDKIMLLCDWNNTCLILPKCDVRNAIYWKNSHSTKIIMM